MKVRMSCQLGFACSVFAAGCDPHAGPGYQGEPLATLRGEVRLESSSPAPSDEVEVFYQNYTDYFRPGPVEDLMRFAIPVSVRVTGDYPAAFALELFEPPPEEVLTDVTVTGDPDERRVGLAVISSSYDCYENIPAGGRCVFGGAPHMAVVWAEEDILPGTRTAELVGTALGAGYHLLEYRANFATWDEYEDCQQAEPRPACPFYTFEREVPMDTSLSVRLIDPDPEVIDIFGHDGGAILHLGGLEMPSWFDYFVK